VCDIKKNTQPSIHNSAYIISKEFRVCTAPETANQGSKKISGMEKVIALLSM
jgi:hypothetical protein